MRIVYRAVLLLFIVMAPSHLAAQGAAVNAAIPSLKTAATLEDSLIAMERQSWVAWKNQDAVYFRDFLSDDHLDMGPNGPITKGLVIGFLEKAGCKVESFAVDSFKFQRLSDDAAMLTYRATQNTMCGAAKVPSPTWSSAIFVKREGRWVQALFQQTTAR